MLTKTKHKLPYKWTYQSPLTERSYIKNIRKLLSTKNRQTNTDKMIKDIKFKADELFFNNLSYLQDAQSQLYYLITSYILATYWVLKENNFPNNEAENIIETGFKKTGEFWIKWPVRIGLFFSKDRMKYLYRISGPSVKENFGKLFEIETTGDPKTQFTNHVTRCGFHEFFKRHGVPELTRLMCSWDENWYNEINPKKHKVVFSRPNTIASGHDSCRFIIRSLNTGKSA